MEKGYLYVRKNKTCDLYNACKLGKVRNGENPINRFQSYKTYEIEAGKVILLLETTVNVDILETELKQYFTNEGFHIYFDAGTEYFSVKILDLIIPILQNNNIIFKECNLEEIDKSNKKNTENNIQQPIQLLTNLISPKEYQVDVLQKSAEFFLSNNIGRINWSCGLGKTLMSLFIVKNLNFKSIVIGVPSKHLQNQFKDEILKIFPNKQNILFIGSIRDSEINTTLDISEIISFIENKTQIFIITTYHSCNLLLHIPEIDFKIGDEAHHLTGIFKDSDKNFLLFHQIKSKKTLFMTATERIIDMEIYSMENEEKFGKIIDSKSVKWAIENKKITDFVVIIIKNTEDEFRKIIRQLRIKDINIELLISAFVTLKSIEKYSDLNHMLIYTNSTSNAEIVKIYIDLLLDSGYISLSKNDVYNNALHSKNAKGLFDKNENIGEISKFKISKYGIISCVYLFGEGFNEPKLNGVTFADKMDSDIRIAQYALRPNRLEKGNENKKAYNIIPYIEYSTNNSFEKCKNIISKLRNIDDTIESKLNLLTINSSSDITDEKEIKRIEMIDNMLELQKLKIKLKYAKALNSTLSEIQNEFNYIRELNKELNITSEEQYFIMEHPELIKDPEKHFGSIWTNWLDFLGINTSDFIKTKEEWVDFCKNNNITSLEEYYSLCELYPVLPKNPEEFYANFTNFSYELDLFQRRR